MTLFKTYRHVAMLLLTLFSLLFASVTFADADSKTKQVNLPTGVKLSYVESGAKTAPVIIFLHGATDSSHSWSSTTPYLNGQYHTYALDQRGHGNSDKPPYGYSVAQFAEDVIAFMDHEKINKAVIVGHSMGSLVAHQIASVYPSRVSKLVLVGSAATAHGNAVILDLWRTVVGKAEFVDPIDPAFIEAWQTGPNPVEPVFFNKVLSETAKVPARVWKNIFRMLETDNHTYFLKDITAPAMVIWGTQDPIFSQADQDALIAALPTGAQFVPFSGAGHNVQWEQPQQVATAIQTFLAQ
ncbi:MAG: hypothetical protein RI964_2995 [Pseudomonadota bacterium]|jgi:pimeloyl-ACP methyl ester carboxylesterase